MKTISRLVTLALVVSLSSCVTQKTTPLSQADAAKLKGASLAAADRDPPPFTAMTASKAALGAFGIIGAAAGAAAMTSSGEKIVKENGVQDPADQISRELAQALASSRGVKVATSTGSKVTSDKVKDVAAAYPGSDYILDVRTFNWASVYFPTSWGHYRVVYHVRMRLIETKTGRIVAEGFHSRIPEKTSTSPTLDQLLANRAALLKNELQLATTESIAHFKRSVLGL